MLLCAEGRILLHTQHVHTAALSFIMGAAHTEDDSGESPRTMTLGGEVGQERVSGAARVGRSTDLVTAPLLLFCFYLSQLLILSSLLESPWIFSLFMWE